ncbi:Chromatin structure remodeling complex protein sfh1 [Myotisia sp. PD_48]|nr:Chromatin structure remodeling complex protein sfh1 [Myotisia sp. PD_48]
MPPLGYVTSYAPRLRQYANSLISPVLPAAPAAAVRTTKRGTAAVNYAENDNDDDDFDDSEGPRRPTGLRSLRREEINPDRGPTGEKLGKEIDAPVNVQANYRDWVVRKSIKSRRQRHMNAQAQLPVNLIPIRIDLEVPGYQPAEPFPLPRNYLEAGINPTLPAYRKPDPAPPYRIKDTFLWNLHEAYTTPEEFATIFVRELDLANPQATALAICNQIRQQLEEYAGVAMHPLFQTSQQSERSNALTKLHPVAAAARPATPGQTWPATPISVSDGMANVTLDTDRSRTLSSPDSIFSPDDAYRCIVGLNINLQNKLYSDKFEWSLLHSSGIAEQFSKITCADLGLGPEWTSSMSHGIHEAVLKLKKEACESGGLISTTGVFGTEIDNQSAHGQEAGWRYDPDGLGDEWEARVETLSKEEIEKREGDRERQIRRLRRETARFSSTGMIAPELSRQGSAGYFDIPDGSETPMGRGERSKRKRRLRSLSPTGRGGTPGGRKTPDTSGTAGYGGGGGTLAEWERQTWRCANCLAYGTAVWAVRDGPDGPRTLCHNCGFQYERNKRLPKWQRGLHLFDASIIR